MTLKASGAGAKVKWIKSSYSTADGPDCVEVAWVKSSHSTDEGPDCLEMAVASARVLIRDSKAPDRSRLVLTPAAWTAFLPCTSED